MALKHPHVKFLFYLPGLHYHLRNLFAMLSSTRKYRIGKYRKIACHPDNDLVLLSR